MEHQGLDHLAIAVADTEAALAIWRDRLGFPLLYSEVVNNGEVKLTHLDLGNTHLQLAEPLVPDHPLQTFLREHGPGLHHFCLRVESVDALAADTGLPTAPQAHQGTQGKQALFIDREHTQQVIVEVTGR